MTGNPRSLSRLSEELTIPPNGLPQAFLQPEPRCPTEALPSLLGGEVLIFDLSYGLIADFGRQIRAAHQPLEQGHDLQDAGR
jgi:hypothetical protein